MRLVLLLLACFAALPAFSQSYFVRFPNDVIVTACDGSDNFGVPVFFNPDSLPLVVEYYDHPFDGVPDACYRFERQWTVYNSATYNQSLGCIYVPNPTPNATTNHPLNLPGPTLSPPGTPAPWNPTVVAITPGQSPTNYSTFWNENPNCYRYNQAVKIIDTQAPVIGNCPAVSPAISDTSTNDPQLWNAAYWWDPPAGINDLREAPVDLFVTGFDSCSGTNVNIRFLLYLDLDQNGTQETVVSSSNPPPPGLVFFDNAANPNFTGGTPQYFDQRPGVDSLRRYRFGGERVWGSNLVPFRLRWVEGYYPDTVIYSLPQLPPGLHRIKWIVEDGCGNSTVCDYNFEMLGGIVRVHVSPAPDLKLELAPNPFRDQTQIRFDLPSAEQVRLQIRNTAGQVVYETDSFLPAGEQLFSIQKMDLGNTPGIYWYSLAAGQSRAVGKVVLLP